ncbi:MAG TPA: hypothetical protein PKV71_02820 [Calditrichia bacterium]|nr:hypothetical protein [Calditrichota bacterium]HQU72168.1 hypothetical protein [Calditrichia bacterium]HQV30775.1 hypothetical protein [Calditrichia bacterium]
MSAFNRYAPCFVLLLMFVVAGCSDDPEISAILPEKVILVAKSADTDYQERGIDAAEPFFPLPIDTANAIRIEWIRTADENLDGYRLYRRATQAQDSTGDFRLLANLQLSDSAYVDETVGLDTTYFYYVAGINSRDEEGPRSRIEYYTLWPKPAVVQPINNAVFTGRFDWTMQALVTNYFSFRIERAQNQTRDVYDPIFFLVQGDFEGNVADNQSWTIDQLRGEGGRFLLSGDSLTPGYYRWRVDLRDYIDGNTLPEEVVERLRIGAESSWAEFEVE